MSPNAKRRQSNRNAGAKQVAVFLWRLKEGKRRPAAGRAEIFFVDALVQPHAQAPVRGPVPFVNAGIALKSGVAVTGGPLRLFSVTCALRRAARARWPGRCQPPPSAGLLRKVRFAY